MKLVVSATWVLLLLTSQNCSAAPASEGVGTFHLRLEEDPRTLNPITFDDVYARSVLDYVFDQLVVVDDNTYKFRPSMAEKFEVSKDGMIFTFTLRKGLKWHDG